MKYLFFLLIALISFSVFAQDDPPVKTDGTKYYLQIYDGETNEKVVYYNAAGAGWSTLINVADYFDGSDNQLWSFETSPNFPGYLLVRNRDESVYSTHSLMSWNWNAYLATDESRPPLDEKEKQFRFVEAFDGYYILETIEKPTDGSLYNINYTPGADAMNVQDGIVSFSGVKTADITAENMTNKVFKIVEFNPVALFEESITRGDDLYNDNPNVPADAAYELFYTLEKARELRVFGTDGEMLEYQTTIDSIMSGFNKTIDFVGVISDAKAFIDASTADEEVKNSFRKVVTDAESLLNAGDISSDAIDSLQTRIENAQNLVTAILDAHMFKEGLAEADSLLSSGVLNSITEAMKVLADDESDADIYTMAVSNLNRTEEIIDEIKMANELTLETQEFEEAKEALGIAIDKAIAEINTAGDLELALLDIQSAIKDFKKALEAGDTPVDLKNADFEDGLTDWLVESPTPGAAYPENKGVDGTRSITFWKGAEYQMKVYQSISNIPNGTYLVSCHAKVNADSTIALYGKSGGITAVLPITGNVLTKVVLEVEVTDGMLEFGIKGNGENNSIPAGRWIVFDEFEVKWASKTSVTNSEFVNGLDNWLVEGVTAAAYPENKGVDGSRSITCWRGADYNVSISQTLTGLANGWYAVSAMAKTNQDSAFVVFGESGGFLTSEYVSGNQLAKTKAIVEVIDGMLKFGVKGAGVDNAVPAGRWIVFDNVEILRMPDLSVLNSEFVDGLSNWVVEGETAAAYPENKGVDGSRSITCWRGADYNISVAQSMFSLVNGTYAVSAMAKTNQDSAFVVFGESAGTVSTMFVSGNQLSKTEAIAEVIDGTLKFGVKGAGVDNAVPAGRWIVFDNVEVKMKSVIPEYVMQPQEFILTELSEAEQETDVMFWSLEDMLNVRASKEIVNYTVYSITGAIVEEGINRSNGLSIHMQKGLFIINVTLIDGETKVSKVVVR